MHSTDSTERIGVFSKSEDLLLKWLSKNSVPIAYQDFGQNQTDLSRLGLSALCRGGAARTGPVGGGLLWSILSFN